MSTTVKKISQLKIGDKFWFNNGFRGELWVLDEIQKDNRFLNDTDPYDVWKIVYHLNIPDANTHETYIDERDTAVVPI